MKASLRDKDGNIIEISAAETTFGREAADVNLRLPNVEVQHAVIQFNEEEQCFVLQDLNTSHGCYVNDTRIQNAAVRLAHGDLIEFGYGNPVFEFHLAPNPVGPVYPIQHPTPSHVGSWTDNASSSLRYYSTTTSGMQGRSFLPYLPRPSSVVDGHEPILSSAPTNLPQNNMASTIENQAFWSPKIPTSSSLPPRPPSMRTRPSSAGVQRSRPVSATSKTSPVPARGTWMSSSKQEKETNAGLSVEELEHRLLRMGDELSRLACYESECHRKDRVISELRDEISELRRQHLETSGGLSTFSESQGNLQDEISELHNDLRIKQESERTASQKLAAFQSQIHQKNKEIASLKQRLDEISQTPNGWMSEHDEDLSTNIIASLRTELAEKDKSIAKLKNELDKNTKQRSHLTSLMNTLQKENASKETLLQHAKTDVEKLKKVLREKDSELAGVLSKLTRQKAAKEAELDAQRTREELLSVKAKYQSCQKQLREKSNAVVELQNEVEKCSKEVEAALKGDKGSQMELDHAKAQFVDSQRELHLVKNDLKQTEKKFDQFSRAILEATFSSGFSKKSRKELEESEIVDHVKQLAEERKRFAEQLDEISDHEERENAKKHSLKLAQEEFEHCLKQIKTTLSWSGHNVSTLRSAIEKLTEYEIDNDALHWIKAVCLNFLKDELSYLEKEQTSLLQAGFDQETVDKGLSTILTQLHNDIQSRQTECKQLQEKLGSMEEVHETTIARLKEELCSREKETVEVAVRETRAEEAEKRLELMRTFKEKESERIDIAIATERRILESQHGSMEQLKKELDEQREECERLQSSLTSVRVEYDEAREMLGKQKDVDESLHKELEEKCSSYEKQMKDLEKKLVDYGASKDNEVASYKEQAHQHALTIVAMEERLIRLSKQAKSWEQEQITKQQLAIVTPKRSRPSSPKKHTSRPSSPNKRPSFPTKEEKLPKASVFTQTISSSETEEARKSEVFKLEQLVLLLRREAADAKKESVEHSEVVRGLKRDLAGAWARLSDVTGELSDQQKQKVEEYQEKIGIQDRELHDQREQLKKLSTLVDFQKTELERNRSEGVDGKVDLDGKIKVESGRQSKRTTEREQAELAGLTEDISEDARATAHRCHGEKHVQVITKQREALREMRQRMKKIEHFKPPFPSLEQALQQITVLKNELSETRAREAGREEDFNRSATELQLEVKQNRQLLSQSATDMAIERGAHEETKTALDKSEQTYLTLIRSVAALLNVDATLLGCRSMAHLPSTERDVLVVERTKSLEMLQERLQHLLKHLSSKNELLKDYNKDLEKLREVEMMSGRKSAELESLATDLDSQNRESNCLRVSLDRTREELDRQKRLNTCLKEKKKFSMDTKEEERPKHSCYVDEQKKFKEEMKRKKMVAKLKRKNFEIESLKQDLRSADAELNNTAAELQALDPTRNFQLSPKNATLAAETENRVITIF